MLFVGVCGLMGGMIDCTQSAAVNRLDMARRREGFRSTLHHLSVNVFEIMKRCLEFDVVF